MKIIFFILFISITNNPLWARGGVEGGGSTDGVNISDGIEIGSSIYIAPDLNSFEAARSHGILVSEKMKQGLVKDLLSKEESKCQGPGKDKKKPIIIPKKLRVFEHYELLLKAPKYDAHIEYEVSCR